MPKTNQAKTKKQVVPQKIFATTPLIIPITDYTPQETFLCKDGSIIDLFQITCSDMNAAKEYDIAFEIYTWSWFFKSYHKSFKIITMNYPVETLGQISNVDRKSRQTQNPIFKTELENENLWLKTAHETYDAREFYLMTFSKDEDEHRKNINKINAHLIRSKLIKKLWFSKKVQIIAKLQNMNAVLGYTDELDHIPRVENSTLPYNPYLLSVIQPQGGVSFHDETLIKKGDGYEAAINIYAYPANVHHNWMQNITLFDNTIATIDVGISDKLKASSDISSSIEEQASRFMDARYQVEKFDAERLYTQLRQLHESIKSAGEVINLIQSRVYVYASTKNELEERVDKITSEIISNGYKAVVQLDETQYESQSLLLPIHKQAQLANKRKTSSIPSETLALGHPYHFSSLIDKNGLYYGYTDTNGTVIHDPYQKDKQRLSYCTIILGKMGSGKSSCLKFRLKKDIICGNYVRGFATNSEFVKLIKYLGGSIINLDGSDGFLNLLQVYRSGETEEASFTAHISKIATFYKFYVPKADEYDLAQLQKLARALYKNHMQYESCNNDKITGLESEFYPTFSDFLSTIHSEMYSNIDKKIRHPELSAETFSRMENIELMISNLVYNYGHIFDGHSSIRAFESEQLVFFNVGNLIGLPENIFDAQNYSATSLLWDNLIAIGEPQKTLFDDGKISLDDIHYFNIYMDEAHNFVNARKLLAVETYCRYERESRKFFGGLTFASQSIRDFLPENSSTQGIDAIKNLFSLAQYKFIFQQPEDSVDNIKTAFGNDLPETYLEELHQLIQGQCILSISGVCSIKFQLDIPAKDLALFSGGA